MIIVGIIATILALFVIFSIFNYFRQKYLQNSKIIDLIKEKKFDEIPKKTETKSIADYYKNDLIDLANEIKDYYEILNKKMAFYENKAYQDQLTGTLNRNFLEENAKKLLLKFKLAYNNTGVIMLDIDDFKKINDTYGHGTGDLALIEVAKTIKKLLRKEDLLIRYGGEEFVILLPNCDLEDTYLIAEKIRKEVEKIKIPLQNKKLSLTISLGITTIKDEDKTIFDSIKRADKALYKAKKSGKNKVAI
jgi:diguanylate cyclase (GGDEF)-like protein